MGENEVVEELSMDDAVSLMLGTAEEPQAEEPKAEEPQAEGPPKEAPAPADEPESDVIEIDPDAEMFETEFEAEEGKVKKSLSLSELQKGYMLHKDYTKKTQALAQERKGLAEEVAKQVNDRTGKYTQDIEILAGLVAQHVMPELKGLTPELAASDPAEYVRLQAKAQAVQQTMAQLRARHEDARKQKESESAQQRAKRIEESVSTLKQQFPDWGDGKYQEFLAYAAQNDIPIEEAREWITPGYFKLLSKAKAYDALQAAKPTVEKKVVTVPKVVKPGAAGQAGDAKSEVAVKAMARLKKSGDYRDAAEFLLASKRR